ncbi:hypothetical protein UFOVP504_30 [uncultured Caudovirales phage]|uniref:Uncharacterized protein n=1 Tax=uncultured Caudovirales phage TaxID=2100421 RepID=A0A6J5SUH8_9CAUD|nr:hypothetical protein UFOVP504_30 [uncultured Caudovirales phage]CAB4178018.1 hypothetical protein UFOVP1011_20 [uncultured Caudovirales phage]CAB4187119.1 hypothetical protein UFOVP1162_44 [uncultured Caudovirales phage]CAB4218900.1 hypothetical protein UFOVP1611_47 [uncultured Caudovirales phage]
MARIRREKPPTSSFDFGPVIVDPTTGEFRYALPVEITEVAAGPNTRATVRRARRADPLNRVEDCTDEMRTAAAIYRQAVEHCESGRGMGPMPWAVDRVQEGRRGDGLGVSLLAQERALSAAEWHRRGVQAMGLQASQGVVHWVVIAGLPLTEYDAVRRWQRHTSRGQLLAALERLVKGYGL